MAVLCGVIGVGQTKHDTKRGDVSMAGLVREAAIRALEDAGLGWRDIDAVVIGKAPDTFEGVMMPEIYLADALGAAGKPMFRVHTAGSVGGSTACVAAHLVQAGVLAGEVQDILLVDVTGSTSASDFVLAGGPFVMGAFEYDLGLSGSQWLLQAGWSPAAPVYEGFGGHLLTLAGVHRCRQLCAKFLNVIVGRHCLAPLIENKGSAPR